MYRDNSTVRDLMHYSAFVSMLKHSVLIGNGCPSCVCCLCVKTGCTNIPTTYKITNSVISLINRMSLSILTGSFCPYFIHFSFGELLSMWFPKAVLHIISLT